MIAFCGRIRIIYHDRSACGDQRTVAVTVRNGRFIVFAFKACSCTGHVTIILYRPCSAGQLIFSIQFQRHIALAGNGHSALFRIPCIHLQVTEDDLQGAGIIIDDLYHIAGGFLSLFGKGGGGVGVPVGLLLSGLFLPGLLLRSRLCGRLGGLLLGLGVILAVLDHLIGGLFGLLRLLRVGGLLLSLLLLGLLLLVLRGQQEAAKPAPKPAAEQETGEKKAAEEKTYEDTNAPTTLTEKAQEAARNVVKIINDYASPLKVILRNLKVDAGDTGKDAVKIEGTGDVTLELEGKNELTGGNSGDFGTRGITSGKGKLTIQGKEGSSLSTTGGSGTKGGSFGICATSGKLDLVNATVTATGGFGGGDGISANDEVNIKNSKLTAKGGGQLHPGEDTSTGGGTGISLFVKGKVVVGEGSEVIAIGGDHKTVKRSAWGGAALRFLGTGVGCGYEVQKGGKLTAIGGNAESKSGVVTGGDALNGTCGISGISGISGGIVSAGETTLIGGNAKSGSGKATGGNASFYDGNSNQVTVKGGTTTALGGKAEGADGKATNGSSIKTSRNGKIGLSVETGGTLVTAMPGERDGKGNGIIGNVEIKTNGGKIEEVENAKVVKKEDGSITVTGDLVGIKQDGHSYELTATVEPTCTTPGKRVYTCTTHVGETYEETIDALGHHFTERMEVVAPTYTSEGYTIYKCANCGETEKREFVPMLVPESNGGSSAVTLTVTGAGAYETSMAEGRYTIAVPAEAAVLSGCLSNLKELKAQGVNTLVFRTQLRETALNIDSMLSLGVDDTLFTLTHSGESAELTVGGFAHNELLH